MRALSSRDFNQDVSSAKRLATVEPVFVTDRGRPTHVLMSIDAFQRLSGETDTIVDLLAVAGASPARTTGSVDDPWRARSVRD